MQKSKEYYETKLYPLQNTILKLLNETHTPFYLTGGKFRNIHILFSVLCPETFSSKERSLIIEGGSHCRSFYETAEVERT